MQVKEGIDAVIVDSVLAIRKGLTEGEKQESNGHGGRSGGNSNVTGSGTNANDAAEL